MPGAAHPLPPIPAPKRRTYAGYWAGDVAGLTACPPRARTCGTNRCSLKISLRAASGRSLGGNRSSGCNRFAQGDGPCRVRPQGPRVSTSSARTASPRSRCATQPSRSSGLDSETHPRSSAIASESSTSAAT
jgi:hypothetical protein